MIDLIYFYILSNQDSKQHCGGVHVHFSYKYIAILIQLFWHYSKEGSQLEDDVLHSMQVIICKNILLNSNI